MANLSPGGIQNVVIRLSKGMIQKGYRVHILVLNRRGRITKTIPPGAQLFDFNTTSKVTLIPKLVGYLRKQKPDGLVSSQPHINVAAILSNLLAGAKVRIVVSEHSDPQMAYKYRASKGRRVTKPYLERIFYPKAHAIVAVSEGVAAGISAVARIPKDHVRVIYNPIVDRELVALSKEKVSWPFEKKEGFVRLLAVGRLNPAKDYATLLHAFDIFRKKNDAQLLILGEGEKRSALEELIKRLQLGKLVALPGHVENPFAYMSIADVFVSSSTWEGFSMVIAEALACGLQVVSTDCPSGPAEILEAGKYGWLVPTRRPAELAEAVQKALKNPLPKHMLRERASFFSTEKAVLHYSKVLGLPS